MRKSKNTGELFAEVFWKLRKGEVVQRRSVVPFKLVKQMDPIAVLDFYEFTGELYRARRACYPRYFTPIQIEEQEHEMHAKQTEKEFKKIKEYSKF